MLVDKDCCLATTQTTLYVTMACVLIRGVFWKMLHSQCSVRFACLQSHVQSMFGCPSVIATTALLGCADEDRRARRRKLGLPEELTEEEKAQEAAAAAQKAEAAKKKNSFVSVKPVSGRLLLASIQSRFFPYSFGA